MPVSQAVSTYERNRPAIVQGPYTASTYTLDAAEFSAIAMAGGRANSKQVWAGTMIAYDPATRKGIPNTSSTGGQELGPLLADINLDGGDSECAIVWEASAVADDLCNDDGSDGVTAATSAALANRITFVVSGRM